MLWQLKQNDEIKKNTDNFMSKINVIGIPCWYYKCDIYYSKVGYNTIIIVACDFVQNNNYL